LFSKLSAGQNCRQKLPISLDFLSVYVNLAGMKNEKNVIIVASASSWLAGLN
jgi:hypothetical protein